MGFAKFTDTVGSIFNFEKEPKYISPFPEGGEIKEEGEYIVEVDSNGDPLPGEKIVKFKPTSDVGKKITVSGDMLQTDAETINTWYKTAAILLFEAQRAQKTYSFTIQMAEPKWVGTGSVDNNGIENLQYSIDLYIQPT